MKRKSTGSSGGFESTDKTHIENAEVINFNEATMPVIKLSIAKLPNSKLTN